MSLTRWLKRSIVLGIDVALIAALLVTGSLRALPPRRAYSSTNGLVPENALLYNLKLSNLVVKDASQHVLLESSGGLANAASVLNTISSGQAVGAATIEGSTIAAIALTKTETQVVSGASVVYQVPLLGMQGTLTETTPGVYSTTISDKLVVTPDLTGLDAAAVHQWRVQPLGYSLNSRSYAATSVTDQVSGLGITDSVNATVNIPLHLYLQGKLLDGAGKPVAKRTLSAKVEAPNHAYTETVSISTDAGGVFTYERKEQVVVTATGGQIARLPAAIQFGDTVRPLAFWWGDGDWFGGDHLNKNLGSPRDNNAGAGDPINLTTGNMYDSRQDLFIPGRGLPLQFARFFNSQADYNGPLGQHWTHSYNASLTVNSDGSVVERDAQGAIVTFTRSPRGSYSPPGGNHDALVKNANGSFTLTKKNGVVWQFGAGGALQSISDANGNAIVLGYDAGGRLTRLTDTLGRDTTLSYDQAGRIVRISDPAGRSIQYSYNGDGDLDSSTDALGAVTRYAYNQGHEITTVTDPDGSHVYVAYDNLGRATSSSGDKNAQRIDVTYNKADQKTLVKDSKGNETTYFYNDDSQVYRIVDPYGHELRYTWDADGNRTAVTDPLGHTTRLSYDKWGNVVSMEDAAGNVTTLEYEPRFSQLTSVTDPGGNVTRYTYDGNGNLVEATDALGNRTSLTYDVLGQVTGVTNPLGAATSFQYEQGNLVAATDPLGNTAHSTYDTLGRPTSWTDALGRTAKVEYDASDRVVRATKADGTTVQMAYDLVGNLVEATDENGRVTRIRYDSQHHPLAVTDPLGNTTQYRYDSEGKLATVTDPLGSSTGFEYDALTRLAKVTRPDGKSFLYSYDAAGNRTHVTDPLGRSTQLSYDQLGRLGQVTDPVGGTAAFLYNRMGLLTQATNPNGHASVYAYDALNRLTQTIDPLGNVTALAYDAVGHVVQGTDGNGAVTRYTYDAAGRLTQTDYPDGSRVKASWDEAGQLGALADPTGTTRFSYDLVGRLTREALPGGRTLRHEYDAAGNRTALVDPQGGRTRFQYDAADQLVAVTDRAGNTTSYTYDALGRPTQVNYPNQAGISYGYDVLSRITSVTNTGRRQRVLAQFNYSYDLVGNPLTVADEQGQVSRFGYDDLDRLLSEVYPDGRSLAYTYDAGGNRTSRTDEGGAQTKYSYDAADQMLQAGNVSYTYDGNGNMTGRSQGKRTTKFAYDAQDRLVTAGHLRYTYDALGRLVGSGPARSQDHDDKRSQARDGKGGGDKGRDGDDQNQDEHAVTYTYDGDQVLQMAAGEQTMHFTRGPGDQLISASAQAGEEDRSRPQYYHFDAIGSVVGLSNAGGQAVARYGYDAFGNQANPEGRGRTAQRQSEFDNGARGNPFTYVGNAFEPSTGLYNFHARWYDATAGRFTSRDPVAGASVLPQTMNPYAYGLNNPQVYVDANGQFAPLVLAAIGAVVGGGAYYLTHRKGNFNWGEFAVWTAAGALMPLVPWWGTFLITGAAQIGSHAIRHQGQFDWGELGQELAWGAVANAAGLGIGYGISYGLSKLIGTFAQEAADGAAAGSSRLLPVLGRKFDYMLGLATGSEHNIARSQAMLGQMRSIGLSDTPATRAYLQEHFSNVLNDATNVVQVQANGRVVRESLLMGPNGGLKVQSVWEGAKLITIKLFGGK